MVISKDNTNFCAKGKTAKKVLTIAGWCGIIAKLSARETSTRAPIEKSLKKLEKVLDKLKSMW